MNLKSKTIVKYKLKGKNYYITFKSNQSLYCAYYEKNQLNDKLTNDELVLALQIYSSLLVQKESSVKVSHKEVNNHHYDIYYDTKSANYFWNNYSSEDNSILNFMYNNQPEFLYFFEDTKKEENATQNYSRYKKLFIAGALLIALEILSIVNPTELPGLDTIDTINEIPIENVAQINSNETTTEVEKKPYDWNRIKSAIIENKNLTQRDKDLLLNFKFLFDAHHDYMDLDTIEEKLRELEIYYHYEDFSGGATNSGNRIDMYFGENSFNQIQQLIHEINHTFQRGKGFHPFWEASDEIWARATCEILEDCGAIEPTSYISGKESKYRQLGTGHIQIVPIYALTMKLMTYDEICLYQYTNDIDIIANALSRYGSIEEAYEFLTSVKEYYNANDKNQKTKLTEKLTKKLSNYYRAKGKDPEQDLEYAGIRYEVLNENGAFKQFVELMKEKNGINRGEVCAYNTIYANPLTNRPTQFCIRVEEPDGSTRTILIDPNDNEQQKLYAEVCERVKTNSNSNSMALNDRDL